jgi:hypothetical protein
VEIRLSVVARRTRRYARGLSPSCVVVIPSHPTPKSQESRSLSSGDGWSPPGGRATIFARRRSFHWLCLLHFQGTMHHPLSTNERDGALLQSVMVS